MSKKTTICWPGIVLVMEFVWVGTTSAQVVQPFFGGVGAFAPQISVASSGVLLDAEVVVSPDRKYVTMKMRPTQMRLIALQAFSLDSGLVLPQQGFPGGVNPSGAETGTSASGASGVTGGGAGASGAAAEALLKATAGSSVLNQRGMIRLE